MNKLDEVVSECLKEMFRRKGLEYPSPELTSKPNWYEEYSWTEKEQDEWFNWMVQHIKDRLKWPKNKAERLAGEILLNWGWTVKR